MLEHEEIEGLRILLGKQEEKGIPCGGWKQPQGQAIRTGGQAGGGELAGPPLITAGIF